MQASIGDRLHVHGNAVGQPDKVGEITEVRGVAGGPPYQVRFEDGHTGLVFPGPDAVVEPAAKAKKSAQRKQAAQGKSAPPKRRKKATA
jgi:uncharacterized protein DUF1918